MLSVTDAVLEKTKLNKNRCLSRRSNITDRVYWSLMKIGFKDFKIIPNQDGTRFSPNQESCHGLVSVDYLIEGMRALELDQFQTQILKNINEVYDFIRTRGQRFLTIGHFTISLSNSLRTRLRSISLPQVEYDILKKVERTYPELRGQLPRNIYVKYSDVLESDYTSAKHFCSLDQSKISCDIPTYLRAIRLCFKQLGFHTAQQVGTVSVEQAVNKIPSDSSSCYPLFRKKGTEEAREQALSFIHRFYKLKDLTSKLKLMYQYPCIVYHRFSNKLFNTGRSIGLRTKIRQFFGLPFCLVLLEGIYFDKFLEVVFSAPNYTCAGLTRPKVLRKVEEMRKACRSSERILCGDIDGMDVSIRMIHIIVFFSVAMYFSRWESSFRTVFKTLCFYHCFTPFLNSDLKLFISSGGNKSGSKITGLLNTYVLLTIFNYSQLIRGKSEDEIKIDATGDDFIAIIDEGSEGQLKQIFGEFGLRLNKLKTKIVSANEGIEYMGFTWDEEGPSAKDFWWLSRIIYPESFVPEEGVGRLVLRICSIIFQIKEGKSIFYKLMPLFPDFWREFLLGYDPIIYYLDKHRRRRWGRLPLSLLLARGWRCY